MICLPTSRSSCHKQDAPGKRHLRGIQNKSFSQAKQHTRSTIDWQSGNEDLDQGWRVEKHGRWNSEGGSDEIWKESVGPDLVPPRSQVSETMQGPLVWMAWSIDKEDRVDPTGRWKVAPPCKIDAHPVADCSPNCGPHSRSMSRGEGPQ